MKPTDELVRRRPTPEAERNEVSPERVVVLYVGGEGRSGSTLLSSMLGALPGMFSVGELRGIWQAINTNELCGCGAPFSECEFWTAVGDGAFGGWDKVDVPAMQILDATYARHRALPRVLIPGLEKDRGHNLSQYRVALASLYAAVKEVSGCYVIVDSTKDPSYAFLLRGVRGIDLRVVHLVRDSRGVAYSWSKADVERPEYANHPSLSRTFMDKRPAWKAAILWSAKNLLLQGLGRSSVPLMVERYESLVANPNHDLSRIMALVEDFAPRIDAVPEGTFDALPHHTLGGNRVRFARGNVSLRVDEEWRREMGARQRFVVSVLTLPLLVWYGYVGRTSAP